MPHDQMGNIPKGGHLVTEQSQTKAHPPAGQEMVTEARKVRGWMQRACIAGRIGLYEWNATRDTTYWSPEAYDLFGLERNAPAHYQRWLGCVHPEDRERTTRSLAKMLDRARVESVSISERVEYRVVHGDGTVYWLDARSEFAMDGGELVMRGAVQDVSDRKQAEQALCESETLIRERTAELEIRNALLNIEVRERKHIEETLRESEARYRALFDSSMDAVFLSQSDGVISSANRAACLLFGMTEEELRLSGRAGVLVPDDPRAAKAVQERAEQGKIRGELRFKRKNGTTFLGEISSVIVADDRSYSFVIIRDISDRKRAEEEILSLNAGLDQRVSERTAELEAAIREQESFSYSVSHDLRAPLRHINSYTAILEEDFGSCLPAEAKGYLDRIRSSSSRMGNLIDDLLELSRICRSELLKVTVSLSELACAVCGKLQEAEPARRVELLIAPGLQAHGDRVLLQQMLENLIGNAWKYSGYRDHARIEFGSETTDAREVFFVKDNGVGFDMAYYDKLFDAFQRLHGTEFEGMGIGLATAQRIIQRHGGKIWAEGIVDQGATFYFSLPAPCS